MQFNVIIHPFLLTILSFINVTSACLKVTGRSKYDSNGYSVTSTFVLNDNGVTRCAWEGNPRFNVPDGNPNKEIIFRCNNGFYAKAYVVDGVRGLNFIYAYGTSSFSFNIVGKLEPPTAFGPTYIQHNANLYGC